MKIRELIYETPEMSIEKLLDIITKNIFLLSKEIKKRVFEIHSTELSEALLEEYDLIQDKKSKLTKSQRDLINGFISLCLIKMTKGDGEDKTTES